MIDFFQYFLFYFLYKNLIFCNIRNVFTVTVGQFNASLLNRSIKKIIISKTPRLWIDHSCEGIF